MGFGFISLATKSEQDNYLVGNPQFTYFKSIYRKHTNFAIDYQILHFPTDTNNLSNKKLYINIPKNGDLLHKLYLMLDVTSESILDLPPFVYNFIDYIDISIGGQQIDRHYSDWYAIWHDLFEDNSKSVVLSDMVATKNSNTGTKTLILPLRFWFNNHIGLSLPLIALQNNDIKLDIKIKNNNFISQFAFGRNNDNPIGTDSNLILNNLRLMAEYIHLDSDERRQFSSNNHEYLITQIQSSRNNVINNYNNLYKSNDFENIRHKIDLRFNYPVKEIFWTIQDIKGWTDNGNSYYENKGIFEHNYWNNYSYGSEQINLCSLIINGKELMEELNADFYRNIQHYKYHKGNGIQDIELTSATNTNYPDENTINLKKGLGVYSYSFSLYPEDYQPSGSINFSKLENIQLRFSLKENPILVSGNTEDNGNFTNKTINIYAVSYNVLRIMSGMAGLAFIN